VSAPPAFSAERLDNAAVRDLEGRTLAHLAGDLSKVVYLSATRDYNTGEYQHEGLAQRYGAGAAQHALARCHEAAFQDLLNCSLPSLTGQLEAYIESTGADRAKVLDSWRRLEAYRVLIPATCDPLTADYFITNVRIALEVLKQEPEPDRESSPAWQPPR
jgi:hypothetical protein